MAIMDATSLSEGPFKAGNDYLALHQIATTPREDLILDTSDGSFAVAVLHHEKNAGFFAPEDFDWYVFFASRNIPKLWAHQSSRIKS